jgi:hypothetical protein
MEQAPQDPLESLLRAAPLNDRQRAGLWDMYEGSKNPDDLAARLKSVEIADDIKAQLWDLKSQQSPTKPSDALPEMRPVSSHGPKAPTWSDKLGLNQPSDSMLGGFVRGSASGAVDLAQGAASEISKMMQRKEATEQAAANDLPGGRPLPRREFPEGMKTEAPDTFSGTIGTYAPAMAGMMASGGPAVKAGKAAVGMIPSATRAGEKFQDVMAAAKDVPVDIKGVGDAALRIQQLADRGGTMPLAVRKLLNRITDPNKAPMAYEEARDFASNISRLSVNEFQRMSPAVAREVAGLRVALNEANALAAKQAGKMDEYKSAMREYAHAMKIKELVEGAIRGAKKGAPIATAAGAGAWLTSRLMSALGGRE